MAIEAFQHLPNEKQENILKSGIHEFSTRSYSEASTDEMTKNCDISKGILFHYFGSKKEFYFYCLRYSIEQLIVPIQENEEKDFYGILFESMKGRFQLCLEHKEEMHMVNMAARESAREIVEQKNEIIARYRMQTAAESTKTMRKAVGTLPLKEPENPKLVEALFLYMNAVLNQYLMKYLETPDAFFEKEAEIQTEIRLYMDFFLKGVV